MPVQQREWRLNREVRLLAKGLRFQSAKSDLALGDAALHPYQRR
jgi:hypothetical protein